jgi:hypothetical protein
MDQLIMAGRQVSNVTCKWDEHDFDGAHLQVTFSNGRREGIRLFVGNATPCQIKIARGRIIYRC